MLVPKRTAEAEFAHLLSPLSLARAATHELAQPYRHAEHLELISDALVRLFYREPGFPRRLMITCPPRHGKSTLCSHWFPTWAMALDPTTKVILTSYELEQASRWGRNVRRSVQELYPMLGTRIVEDSRAAHRWDTSRGGGMVSAGVRGPITGKGGSILICDDPVKNAEEANSVTIQDSMWDWWTTTFLSREQPNSQGEEPVLVFIGTRWHESDLAGRLMESPEWKGWHHIHLRAIAESMEPGKPETEDPLRRAPGEALWPEMFDALALEGKRAEMGSRAFQALYQGNPQPPGGIAILRSWWRYYDVPPPIEEFDQLVLSVDPTFKGNSDSDYVAMGVLGRKGADFYVLDLLRKQMNGPDTIKAITGRGGFDERWPQVKWALIEDTASGSMICDILERDRGHVLRGRHKSRQKEVRLSWQVNGAAALIERGAVHLPSNNPVAGKLVDEGAVFPHGKNDDLLDMLVQGLEHLLPRAWAHENKLKRDAKNPAPQTYTQQMSQDLWAKVRARIRMNQKTDGRMQFPGS